MTENQLQDFKPLEQREIVDPRLLIVKKDVLEIDPNMQNVLNRYSPHILYDLVRIKEGHSETYVHSLGVARIASAQARRFNVNESGLSLLQGAALLHDEGKLDPKILPLVELERRLEEPEIEEVKRHPMIAYEDYREKFPHEPEFSYLIGVHHWFSKHYLIPESDLIPQGLSKIDQDRLRNLGLMLNVSDEIEAQLGRPRSYQKNYHASAYNTMDDLMDKFKQYKETSLVTEYIHEGVTYYLNFRDNEIKNTQKAA